MRANDMPERMDFLRAGFADPPADCRPLMRWWWFGPDVDRDELARELEAMRRAGLGGAEVAVVYPLSKSPDSYLSDTFLVNLRFAADEARRLGLRLDLTVGSGWSYGGPHVTADLASRRLHWDRQEIGMAAVDLPAPVTWPGDELVAAYVGDGSATDAGVWEPVQVVDGVVRVPEGRGPRVLLVAVSRLTGQQVKRAAAGAEGRVLDHYSVTATARHIEAVGERLLSGVPADLLGSVFCDSLEVYGADWTPGVLEEFHTRRGYDPAPLLWLLHVHNRNVDRTDARRFRADYYRTLTELCEENFIAPMQRWAASHGVAFRIQAYGVPPVGVSSYRYADSFEGEGWGWKDIPPTRWASSAAQIYGRSVTSAESWTWVHSPSFRAAPLDLLGEAHEHLLLGINQFVGHGWPYSPPGADGLGWFFYAAGALDDRNPWWPAAGPLNRYLQRLCWLMRQGERIADVGLYAPLRDVYAGLGSGQRRALDLWHGTREHIGFELVRGVREAGFDFVLFDDDAIEVLDPDRFSVIVLPFVQDLPDKTRAWLDSVERAGGRVCSVGGSAPAGTTLGSVPELVEMLHTELTPDVTLAPAHPAVGTVHRRVDDVDVYLVVNTGPETVRFGFGTRDRHARTERWDPIIGQVLDRSPGDRPIPLTLEAYQAAVLIGFDDDGSSLAAEPADRTTQVALDGWSVRFDDEDVAVPVRVPHRWEDDPVRRHYSGGATYSTSAHLDRPPDESWLDLGSATPIDAELPGEPGLLSGVRGPAYRVEVIPPVGEIAEVTVNGNHAGILWCPPYRLPIGHHLRGGDNHIEIRVSNTNANALAVDRGVAAFTDTAQQHYGNRFAMQHIDRATIDVNSGLLAVPRLVVREG